MPMPLRSEGPPQPALREDLVQLRTWTEGQFAQQRTWTEGQFAQLRTWAEGEFKVIRQEMAPIRQEMATFRQEMSTMREWIVARMDRRFVALLLAMMAVERYL